MQVIGSFFAAAIAWVVLEFVGRPIRKFFDLRGEIIQKLVEYGKVQARYNAIEPGRDVPAPYHDNMNDLGEEEIKRLDEAKKCFRELAARMQAFAENETMALWAVRLYYNLTAASLALMGLSNSYEIYGERARHRDRLVNALRFSVLRTD